MRTLVIGGSGRVGSGVLPILAQLGHDVTNLDIRPASVEMPGVRYVQGSLFDAAALKAALAEANGVIYMALHENFQDFDAGIEINVRGVYHALATMVEAGVKHVVHAGTTSAHNERDVKRYHDESLPLAAVHAYGLTKGMSEMACEYYCRVHPISIITLRLVLPTAPEQWRKWCVPGKPIIATTHRDTARAFDAALRFTDHVGFDAIFISGDHTGRIVNCAKAKRLLGWEPEDRWLGADAAEKAS